MANTKRSVEREKFWRDVMSRFDRSGLSARAFCAARGLSEPSFYAWRRILAERDGGGRTRPAERPAFLPVMIRPEPSSTTSGLSLELRSGRVLRFGDALPAERIAAVIRALESEVRP